MIAPFEFTYCKNKHRHQTKLFETLEQSNTGLRNLQNYVPFYHRFFLLSESNYNSIGLNHRYHVASVAEPDRSNKHKVTAALTTDSDDAPVSKVPAFIKYSPLLDPIKYLSGKYDMQATDLLALPTYAAALPTSVHQTKMHDVNNASYVDAFFTYLTSQVLHTHGFVHGLDFYGSFLANQAEFTVNVYDEMDYFSTCDFFSKHRGKLFRMDSTDAFESNESGSGSGSVRPSLQLCDTPAELELDDLTALHSFNDVFEAPCADEPPAVVSELVELDAAAGIDSAEESTQLIHATSEDDTDSCSSRSSASSDPDEHTNVDNESNDKDNDNENEVDSNCDSNCDSDSNSQNDSSDYDSNYDDEVCNAHIFNFPVHAILMEQCDNTLDSLMYAKNEMTEPEWAATLMQIIMALVAYQHMFAFTHNDLHTNNIMFVKTDKKFLHYLYGGVYYRVPTYGRIMKIIDFGRAIYKYRGQTLCSDSFHRTGDAATQYNCEPYMNPKKPRLDPNPSFDLCRLACSLFDYFVEDIRDEAACVAQSRAASVVVDWLKDDKGRNVLYKKNGDERYPEFKLYKMIARTVHGAVPHEQLSKPMFAHYAIARKHINGKPHIMNIDALPCYKDL
jgi:hypothetical protein